MPLTMKGTPKSKVVTSGRLTGGKAARRRVTPNPGPVACPEPAYSLYSTDSEDQVSSLHKGLDRCAALLSDMLRAEKAEEASAGRPKALKSGVARSKPSTALGRKPMKKLPTKSVQKNRQTVAGKLHATQKQPVTLLQSHLPPATSTHQTSITPPQPKSSIYPPNAKTTMLPPQPQTSIPPPHPQASSLSPHSQTSIPPLHLQTYIPPSQPKTSVHPPNPKASVPPPQSSIPPPQSSDLHPDAPHTHCDREEDEYLPVRDTPTPSPVHSWPLKVTTTQLDPGQADHVPEDTHTGGDGSSETEVKVKTVQYLLGELKALIAGQGSVADRLLSHLEQSLPLPAVGGSNIQTEAAVHRENTQLRRRVRTLNQQLKEREKAERQQNAETHCNSAVSALQEELSNAQARLQELQGDLTELREALEDTRSQLTDREAQNAAMKTELEATRSRLLDSERQKSELASLAQERQEEIENLNRILQSQDSSASLPTKHLNPQQHRPDPVDPPTDRITHFLMSLEPTHTEHVCVAADELRDTLSHPDVKLHPNSRLHQSHRSDEIQPCARRLSHCESVASDWSARSGTTFNTRDEAAFRDGLAALDASIASLQKSIQLDLGR